MTAHEEIDDALALGGNSVTASADLLKSLIERVEMLDEEIRQLNASKSDVYAEAKGRGFDTGIVKWMVKERRLDPQKRSERNNLRDLYAHAVGMTE